MSYERALEIFNGYVILQKDGLKIAKITTEDIKKRIDFMDKKVIHTLEVVSDGSKVLDELGFNASVKEFSKIAFLDHDIGRFSQMRYTGSYNDNELKNNSLNVSDHGQLGKEVLLGGVINQQIPETRVLDEPISQIVGDHVSRVGNKEELSILSQAILKNEDILEIFKNGSDENKKKIIAAITQIVQDVDRLDIFHQILDDRWTPLKTDDEIDQRVFDMFYNGEYLDMASLRQQNLWNANIGDLVRLGFVNQIRLLSVAKVILQQDIILRLKDKRQNSKVRDAFEYTHDLLKEMINNSEDGITVGDLKKR